MYKPEDMGRRNKEKSTPSPHFGFLSWGLGSIRKRGEREH